MFQTAKVPELKGLQGFRVLRLKRLPKVSRAAGLRVPEDPGFRCRTPGLQNSKVSGPKLQGFRVHGFQGWNGCRVEGWVPGFEGCRAPGSSRVPGQVLDSAVAVGNEGPKVSDKGSGLRFRVEVQRTRVPDRGCALRCEGPR